MNIIIDLTPEQMEELGPQLDAMEISHRVNLIDIEWENSHKKESVYQVALGEDLHQMATNFNHILERMGMVARFRDPDELNMEEKSQMLSWLNQNARWSNDPDPNLIETWLEGSTKEMEQELAWRPNLLGPGTQAP